MLGWRGTWIAGGVFLALVALPTIVLGDVACRAIRSRSHPGTKIVDVPDWTMRQVVASPTFWLVIGSVLAPPFIGTTLFFHQVYLTQLRGWTLGPLRRRIRGDVGDHGDFLAWSAAG